MQKLFSSSILLLIVLLFVGCASVLGPALPHQRSDNEAVLPRHGVHSDAGLQGFVTGSGAGGQAADASSLPSPSMGAPVVRGYLTTPQELAEIRKKADAGIEPYAATVKTVLQAAQRKWDYELDALQSCRGADNPAWLDEGKGIPRLYARALAYHLTADDAYAGEVKEILERIMTEVVQIDLTEQQCRLNFGWNTPELVASADLVEAYWRDLECSGPFGTQYGDLTLGVGGCKILFQNWLVKNPYYVVSFTAEDAMGNWGAAATNALAYVADYLWDRPTLKIVHRMPLLAGHDHFFEITMFPSDAYAHANQLMFERMNGYGVDLHSSTSCDYLEGSQQDSRWPPVKSQITADGIIPEDARRQEKCNVPRYNGSYQNYPQVHLGNNIQQCELMLRRGDSSCFDNVATEDLPNYSFKGTDGVERTTHLYPGRGSIERAIKAIIVDSQTEWRHDSALAVAVRYYYHHKRLPGFDQWLPEIDHRSDCDQDICFGVLTHGFAQDETPSLPPTVPAP